MIWVRIRAAALLILASLMLVAAPVSAEPPQVEPLLARIRAVEAEGKGNREASQAWQELVRADSAQLPAILRGADGAGPLATNWIRAAFETIAERTLKAGGKLPIAELEGYLAETAHNPRGRRLAYEWIVKVDASAAERLVPTFLTDPSPELRREAIARELAEIETLSARPTIVARYRSVLSTARDFDQVLVAAKKLKDFGESPNIAGEFGFLRHWWLVAPFDNTNRSGFDVAYPPEKAVDLKAEYPGKGGMVVTWKEYTLPEQPDEVDSEKVGNIDLNEVLGKHKGAIAYAYTEFVSDRDHEVEFRLGCITGNKLWVNGQFLASNHVYHANTELDQYIVRGRLKSGKNAILLKIAQNEQTESWAQRWHFQFRITDLLGAPIREKK